MGEGEYGSRSGDWMIERQRRSRDSIVWALVSKSSDPCEELEEKQMPSFNAVRERKARWVEIVSSAREERPVKLDSLVLYRWAVWL